MANQSQAISLAQKKKMRSLRGKGLSSREIGRQLGVHHTVVLRYWGSPAKAEPMTAEEMEARVRKDLKRAAMYPDEVAEGLGITTAATKRLLAGMARRGVLLIEHPNGLFEMASAINIPPGTFEIKTKPGIEQIYGVTTDNHLCSKYSRLDVLNAAYDHFERLGITHVFNAGNMIDGEARFNKTELVTSPGMDNQIDYLIDKWPVRKGIITHFIAGDDHEGWYAQREGIEIGRYMETRAKDQGRNDLHYLGYAEADVSLRCGSGAAVCRVVHPGGGSAYAVSYTDQKRVESYQGGEKPQLEIVGHYHKFNHGFPREVETVQCGCTSDQSLFMRKRRLQAMVGFVELRVTQDDEGMIQPVGVKWFRFYDRGFYERRYK